MQRALFPKDGLPKHLRDDFEIFWAAYPARKPNPRALAEVAYGRAVREGVQPNDLARAAARYSDEVREQKIDAAFVVHAATFLRQRRYLDYLNVKAPAPEAATRRVDEAHPLRAGTRGRISDTEFVRWIMPLLPGRREGDERACFYAPTVFHRDWVRQQYATEIREALKVRVLFIDVYPSALRPAVESAP
ncbi:MAG: hypothetical protein INF88_17315 [Roseomonas sp.]|nr:hypothetical protein [Roseomonas sp.]